MSSSPEEGYCLLPSLSPAPVFALQEGQIVEGGSRVPLCSEKGERQPVWDCQERLSAISGLCEEADSFTHHRVSVL